MPNDVYPKAGSALIGAGDPGSVVADDFNGTARNGAADVGAYVFDPAGNPGWALSDGFKDETPVAATGGNAGTGAGGSGAKGSGGSGANRASSSDDDSGCGCRAAPRGGGFGSVAILLFALLRAMRVSGTSHSRDTRGGRSRDARAQHSG
jgi:hypothetical protein